jgi:hypothetical protein
MSFAIRVENQSKRYRIRHAAEARNTGGRSTRAAQSDWRPDYRSATIAAGDSGAMRTRTISRRSKTLNELLKQAQREDMILQTEDGQRFVLAPVRQGWQGYELDEPGDITTNPALMKHLLLRRRGGQRISRNQVKLELGLG